MGIGDAAFAVVLAFFQGTQPAPTTQRLLDPGRPVEGHIEPGEGHSYSIALQESQFLRLAVVQDAVDVVLTLSGPSGPALEIDVPDGRFGAEPASVLASETGTYRLAIRAKQVRESTPGRYVIETEEPRTATEADRSRAAAERSLAEAAALIRAGDAGSAKAALEKLGESLRRWRALADPGWEGQTLVQRALAHTAGGDHAIALEEAGAAARLWRQIGDRRGEASALTVAGSAHQARAEFEPAMKIYQEAIGAWRATGERHEQAALLWRLRAVYRDAGDSARQVEVAREALALLRAAPPRGRADREWEMSALSEMAAARVNAGDLEGGLADFREAVAIGREIGDTYGWSTQLQNVGAIYEELGDSASALATMKEVLPELQAAASASEPELRSQKLAILGNIYHNMGRSYSSLGQSDAALECLYKALALTRQIGNRRGEAIGMLAIGRESNAAGDFEKAAGDLEAAVKITVEVRDVWHEAAARAQLGRALLELGRRAEARDHLLRAVELSGSLGDALREAEALQLLGRLANETGDLAEARSRAEAALAVLEARRRRLTNPRLRSTLASSFRGVYDLYVDVLMGLHRQQPGQGFDARALEASEHARARGLLDLLSRAALEVHEGADEALLAREQALGERLSAAIDGQLRFAKGSREVAEAAARRVQLLSAEWDELHATLASRSPRFMEVRDPPPPSAAAIQKDVLDADTVLLEYALGEKRSFLWVVSRNGLATHELPARAVVNEAAREAYTALAELGPQASRPAGAAQGALARLSRMVLEPAADALRARRILVVADGALHYVPFAALPRPGGRDSMVATHEIVSAPAASVLPLLRRDLARTRPPGRTVMVVADPVFGRDDERVRGRHATAAAPSSPPASGDDLGRVLRSAGLDGGLPRLPFTRREAQAILSLVPPDQRKEALDFDASRATVTDATMAGFRIVHFATHGFINTAQPELSGIVLSLFDSAGRPARGFLTAADIFNLRLNAELVVLSGCRTALGQEMRGEGLVGLSRGFMYAGSPRVMASLWKVDDAATAELMKRLYHGILKDGLTPAAALRAAQLDLMKRPRYRDPFYWAAFQLQGEWR